MLLSPAAEGLKDPKVFLLSMFELGEYAFRLLEESMVRGLESHKRHTFLVALPNERLQARAAAEGGLATAAHLAGGHGGLRGQPESRAGHAGSGL